jgi:NitT/TauT family transport system substrate-binding protein
MIRPCFLFVAALLAACSGRDDARRVVRIGHFPNITHAHGLLGHHQSRLGQGVFERHLGADVAVEWYVFNAGPSAMEALLAGSIDATYVGPNPALNAHVRSKGQEVRILGGATDGGAALVVRTLSGIEGPADLRGRKIATPQFGNTQDVACRAWLGQQGFAVTQTGGDVLVVPTENPEQLALFQSGGIDAAWTVEPWVTRLVQEGGGRVLVEEADAVTTVLVGSAAFIAREPELAKRLGTAHRELTQTLRSDPAGSQQQVAAELTELTKRPIALELVQAAWPRLRFTDEVRLESLVKFLEAARAAGFVKEVPDLANLLVRQ